jgi:hypothetical protein
MTTVAIAKASGFPIQSGHDVRWCAQLDFEFVIKVIPVQFQEVRYGSGLYLLAANARRRARGRHRAIRRFVKKIAIRHKLRASTVRAVDLLWRRRQLQRAQCASFQGALIAKEQRMGLPEFSAGQ